MLNNKVYTPSPHINNLNLVASLATGVIMLLSLCACRGKHTQPSSTHPAITVSIPPLEYFAREIGGDSIDIYTLLPAGADPETFEPGTATMRSLGKSSLIAVTGYLPFENSLLKNIKTNNDGITIVSISDSIQPIYGTHTHHSGHGHVHEDESDIDPHVWTSIKNARLIATNMLNALSSAAPAKKEFFATRHRALMARLDSLDSSVESMLDTIPSRTFIIWHPSLSYFARDYSLNQIAINAENKETSSQQMKKTLGRIETQQPIAFIVPTEIEQRQTETITAETGLAPVKINFMSANWEQTITDAANALTQHNKMHR